MKKRINLLTAIALASAALTMAMPVGAAQPWSQGPCDIYGAAGTPCVAAHSTTRALYAAYDGPLYQVKRQSDGATLDIGVVPPTDLPFSDAGGYAGAAAQDAFCVDTLCVVNVIYDQSGKGNHLYQAPPGPSFKGPAKGAFDTQPIADMAPITISGRKAYGVYIMPGMGMRNNNARDVAIKDEPQGIYSVVDGTHYDSGCCFNYGNASTNGLAVGTGTMETTYFGTSTVWGRGDGPGPWIMSDMEAGLFSGYDAKLNAATPTIDSWRFVTAVVDGGGGNRWDLRGGNAQVGGLTTFYSGERPHSRTDNRYFPMRRQGAILLGNGGDNGNGSAGTFFEGVMTTGFPTEATTNAVQANIVAAKYDVARLSLSRVTSLTPGATQEVTATFDNTTGAPAAGVKLSVLTPMGWTAAAVSTTSPDPIAPGASVSTTFRLTSPATAGAGYLTGKAVWTDPRTGHTHSESVTQRVRNVLPVKINEVRFGAGANTTDQFIELYNASDRAVDISGWTLVNTPTEWASVKLATIPAGTTLAKGAYYLLGLSSSGLAAPAGAGETTINVRSATGFEAGKQLDIDGETRTIASVGAAATAMTTLFIPVSTGPWLMIPAGATNLPVTDATGFAVGQKMGIDAGGNYELVTVTAVGKAATQTVLAAEAAAGATKIKLRATDNLTVGDLLTVDTGARIERVQVAAIGSAGENGSGINLSAPLKLDHRVTVDVSAVGTGITFTPATKFAHISGEALQALGAGIKLDKPLSNGHDYGAPVGARLAATEGYQGHAAPNQWFGGPLSARAGSIALLDAGGEVVVDAVVYGSRQSNSSANGTITSPELATLEGDQHQGGCIAIAPRTPGGFGRLASPANAADITVGRFPDGADADSNCTDFVTPPAAALSVASPAGAVNIKMDSVEGFLVGQTILVDSGAKLESRIIATVGTAGGSAISAAAAAGANVFPVASVTGFNAGQTITIDSGANQETAVVAATSRRGGGSITIEAPLTRSHAAGAQVSGSGITLTAALAEAHAGGVQVADSVPTPGAANKYSKSSGPR